MSSLCNDGFLCHNDGCRYRHYLLPSDFAAERNEMKARMEKSKKIVTEANIRTAERLRIKYPDFDKKIS